MRENRVNIYLKKKHLQENSQQIKVKDIKNK